MEVFHVQHNGTDWVLREVGAVFVIHAERTREAIGAYVEGYMACIAGKVIFHREDGSVEVEKIFRGKDPRKAGLFAQRGKAVTGVKMPLISEEDWTRVDLDRVEKRMVESYSKLTPALIQLMVRLARLDVPPSAGIDRLCKETAVLLDKARSGPSAAEVTRRLAE